MCSTNDQPATPEIDLETVLGAWHDATERLQRTHETLRAEVRRLTRELEIKNRELARKNRLADLGQMASHVAHEVRNNLVPITLYLSLLRRRLSEDPLSLSTLTKVEAGFTALEATVSDLLQFGSHRDPVWQHFPVRELVEDVCQSLAPQLEAQQVFVRIDIPHSDTLVADRHMLRRALLNLLLNALDAMPGGGEVLCTSWENDGYELEIADSGAGIADLERDRLFEPFFTTKNHGTGLGLAIVDRIIALHGGAVWAENCPQGGAAFTLRIPRRAMRAAA
ncbi:MAG: sensor histidine kinase [Planctomycetes bacterium]|nr:sensor histidine kinase [Planctomycetota bacterium]